jgi:vanillate O-demethylase ferredoxin subunit
LRDAWSAAGRPPQRLRFETFGTSGHEAAQAFWVEVPRHHLRFEVPADRSLLEALESHGVACLADCLRGECGLCTVDVLSVEGRIDHRDVFMSRAEQRDNRKLCACVSRVAGGGITIDSAWRPDGAATASADPVGPV